MPSITGRVSGWTKGPPRAFTIKDDRNSVSVTIDDGVDAEALALAALAKGTKDTVTVVYTANAGPPPTNTITTISSP